MKDPNKIYVYGPYDESFSYQMEPKLSLERNDPEQYEGVPECREKLAEYIEKHPSYFTKGVYLIVDGDTIQLVKLNLTIVDIQPFGRE